MGKQDQLSEKAVTVPYSDSSSVMDKKAPGWCKGDVTIHCGPFGDIGATWDICGFWSKVGQSSSLVYGSETSFKDVTLNDNTLVFTGGNKESFLQYNTDIIYITSTGSKVLVKKGIYHSTGDTIEILVILQK